MSARHLDMGVLRGYPRSSGKVGFRNVVLILSVTGLTGPIARHIANAVRDTHAIAFPYGTGLVGDDRRLTQQALVGLASNPNVGACLLICDNQRVADQLANSIQETGQLVSVLTMDDVRQDAHQLTSEGIRRAAQLVRDVSALEREEVPVSSLQVGLKCGRSDPSSSLAANPAVGHCVDDLLEKGASVIFGETLEWLGAEHLLAARAGDQTTREALLRLPAKREQRALSVQLDLMGNNPSQANIEAGISTIEEKALGGITKTGSLPINGVLEYGQTPQSRGLFAMDTPSYAPEHLTALAAAGCQVCIFTTGVGNSFVSGLCPTIKVSANKETCNRLSDQIDAPIHGILEGELSQAQAADNIARTLSLTASGMLTMGEILHQSDDVISRFGAAL